MQLRRRAVYIPIKLKDPPSRRAVFEVARALERGALDSAARAVASLEDAARVCSGSWEDPGPPSCAASHDPRASLFQDMLRAAALTSALLDLADCGWSVTLDGAELYLLAPFTAARTPQEILQEKDKVRARMRPRVEEQLRHATTYNLIRRLERPHPQRGTTILDLIADGEALARSLEEQGPAAIRPYLEPAAREDGDDRWTGLPLYECFCYLRLLWSFPSDFPPGRRLPFLIRDAGQPNHPVCGLLCLSSPVAELGARDGSMGWTPAWAEAVVACLDAPLDSRASAQAQLSAIERELARHRSIGERTCPEPSWVAQDVAALLELPQVGDLGDLARALAALGAQALEPRRDAALLRLGAQLTRYLDEGLEGLSFEGLDVTLEDMSAEDAGIAWARLKQNASESSSRWRTSTRPDEENTPLDKDALFAKKRARRAVALLTAKAGVGALQEAVKAGDASAARDAMRALTSDRLTPWTQHDQLSAGSKAHPALRQALREHKIDLLASRAVDISLCGAVDPYRELLLGKLAALLPFSLEVAQTYHARYQHKVSQIQSKMAGQPVVRSADLCAMITTGFYAFGSAQYNRLALPTALGGTRWRRAGESEGHGSLHFSKRTSELLQLLLDTDTRATKVTGTFGEGPSERLRKLRNGLDALGLPAAALLQHGMSRAVYTARLTDDCLPGAPQVPHPHREVAPSTAQIVDFWRDRWLSQRLQGRERLEAVRRLDKSRNLLSANFPEVFGVTPHQHKPRGNTDDELRAAHQPLLW